MTSTSELAERRRDRLQRLLQNATGEFELRFEFGEQDRLSPGHLILGLQPDLISTAGRRQLIGRVLHLLGHYLHETTDWWPTVQREENHGRPHFTALWHALEDARIENAMLIRWPGVDKFFQTNLPPPSLIRLMATTQQVEIGLYLMGRGVPISTVRSSVQAALNESADFIRAGAQEDTPRASMEAAVDIYPLVVHLLRAEHVPQPQRLPPIEKMETRAEKEGATAEREREIATSDDLVTVGLTGRKSELPNWFQPGNAPWFERGLGDKEVHPSAVRVDRETVVAPPKGNHERYQELLAEVKHDAGLLLRRLTSLLREDAYLRYGGHYRTGALNTAKLWRQRLGVYRLFQRRIGGEERQAAITLLVDESASMVEEVELATKATILLGETISQLDVPLEIIGFTTSEYEAQAAMKLGLRPAYEYRTTRCSPLEHRVYKRFDEPYPLARARLAGIRARNNNWDEEHLLFAFRRIRARMEARKIIVVISDGQPNGDAEYLVRTVQSLETMDCKVIGVGIGADFVHQIYPHALVVRDIRQFTLEMLEILTREFGLRAPRNAPARTLIENYGAAT